MNTKRSITCNQIWPGDKIDLHHIKTVAYGGRSKLNNCIGITRKTSKNHLEVC